MVLDQPRDLGVDRLWPLFPEFRVDQDAGFLLCLVEVATVEAVFVPAGPDPPAFVGLEQMALEFSPGIRRPVG